MSAVMREEGENFLAAKAKEEGVVVLPSGLQYKVINEGTGKKPKATDKVKCHYEGTFVNGAKFDSSYDRNEPAVFGLNQVIPGWTEGVQLDPADPDQPGIDAEGTGGRNLCRGDVVTY